MPKRIKTNNIFREKAKQYINQGYSVFHLAPKTKIPIRGSHGYKDASTSIDTINDWWDEDPTANVAIATGKVSGIVVIDIDVKNGKDGTKLYDELVAKFNIPNTRSVNTPSGGKHYYFSLPENEDLRNRIDFKSGIDVLGSGGSVVAPPSVTDVGKYEWEDENIDIAEIPSELLQLLLSHQREDSISLDTKSPLNGIPEGRRDDNLFRYACSLRAKGTGRNEAEILIKEVAKKCTPTFSENDAIKCLNSAWDYTPKFSLTEVGNAERLAYFYSKELKYVDGIGWLCWSIKTNSWVFSNASAKNLAIKTVKLIEAEVKNCNDDQFSKKIYEHFSKSQTDRTLNAILNIAKTMPEFELSKGRIDSEPYKLQVNNGILDLRTGKLIQSAPEIIMTKKAPITYNEDADCPQFIRFLDDIFEGDSNLIKYLQRAIGYTLTGDNSEQCMFIMQGDGSNGKSVLQSILYALLGDYALSAPPQMLIRRVNNSTNDLARLDKARLLTFTEEASGNKLNEALVKQLSGGDHIASRKLYGEFSDSEVTAKFWMSTNHLPKITGIDHAIWRRIKVIPFLHRVTTEHQDPFLRQKLFNELPGILNWAIEGCLKWQEHRLGTCEAVDNATNAYRKESDILFDWINAQVVNESTAITSASSLYNDYTKFTETKGGMEENQTRFGKALKDHGYHSSRTSNGIIYHGISLNSVAPRKRKRRKKICS